MKPFLKKDQTAQAEDELDVQSSTDEWTRKMWYLHLKQYYSAIKKNKSELVPVKWMSLEPVIQSEVSQKEKNKYSILMHIFRI